MFGVLHCMAKKIEAEVFGELRNMVLEENGEDKNDKRKYLMKKLLNE